MKPEALSRQDFVRIVQVTTRWNDNDVYGHINNAVYFEYFDSAVNQLLVEAGVLHLARSGIVGLMVETRCSYFASLAFPSTLDIGVAVEHIGRSSVRYRLGVFAAGAALVSAQGAFTHVHVSRADQRPVAIPADVRAVLEALRLDAAR